VRKPWTTTDSLTDCVLVEKEEAAVWLYLLVSADYPQVYQVMIHFAVQGRRCADRSMFSKTLEQVLLFCTLLWKEYRESLQISYALGIPIDKNGN
jgi:hypothetical protein